MLESGMRHDDTELAAEILSAPISKTTERRQPESWEHSYPDAPYAGIRTAAGGSALGWTALIFALLSLFIWPIWIGPTAAVLGYMAYRQGAGSVGLWAIILGLLTTAGYFFIPAVYAVIT
jgi:hypothetical protein